MNFKKSTQLEHAENVHTRTGKYTHGETKQFTCKAESSPAPFIFLMDYPLSYCSMNQNMKPN